MEAETVQLKVQHHKTSMDSVREAHSFEGHTTEGSVRRSRPKSASYAALRSAVFQLNCLSDFTKEKIGSGFFADVFKVKHKVSGEVMVLKMNKSRKTSKQMLSEIQLMNRLSHPNILKFKGSCVHEGQLHALTEFINGGSLEDLLHDRSVELSWSVRVKIARDIARGMAYLHSRGVFHRDLNSRNCLIQKHPNGSLTTVVADFGLAAKIKQKKRRSYTETVGSPYWMAPECLNGKQYCELADVFSFGITLAEIMTRMPADPDFIPRTSHYGVNSEALQKLCVGCPEELFQLACNCCQLDPDDRPSFEEAVQILDSLAEKHNEGPNPPDSKTVDPSTADDDHYLRSCFSEPFLKLSDPTTDSSGSSVHMGYRLGSIGSSTASTGSSCDSFSDSSRVASTSDVANMLEARVPLAHSIATSQLEYAETTPTVNVTNGSVNHVDGPASPIEKYPAKNLITAHRELKKTSSLTLPGSKEANVDPVPSTNLNCSVQTLIADEDNATNCNGGGDSGIDPGELEVFKFPPNTEGHSIENGTNCTVGIQRGEHTPILSSPSHKMAAHKLTPEASSPHGLSPVRTPSDGSVSCTYATPSSPFAQSWASSEFSFYLPNPSTPYAPPCTPVSMIRRSNSCPSSPNSHRKQFRFSLDITNSNFSSVYGEGPQVDSRNTSCRNSAIYFDQGSFDLEDVSVERKHSHNPKRRSVHFLENDKLCTNLDQEHFSKVSSRNRSHSNPARPIMKLTSSYAPDSKEAQNYSLTLANCEGTLASPKHSNSLLCKGYSVTMKSNARLSSSAPNLFVW